MLDLNPTGVGGAGCEQFMLVLNSAHVRGWSFRVDQLTLDQIYRGRTGILVPQTSTQTCTDTNTVSKAKRKLYSNYNGKIEDKLGFFFKEQS
jgi:hypothetical protein